MEGMRGILARKMLPCWICRTIFIKGNKSLTSRLKLMWKFYFLKLMEIVFFFPAIFWRKCWETHDKVTIAKLFASLSPFIKRPTLSWYKKSFLSLNCFLWVNLEKNGLIFEQQKTVLKSQKVPICLQSIRTNSRNIITKCVICHFMLMTPYQSIYWSWVHGQECWGITLSSIWFL